ncbi:MAG: hypothetical protein ACJ790_14115 [Myxococcaceae bacterium]
MKAEAEKKLGPPEETALVDAFSELVQFVHAHHDLFSEDELPICVVLGDIGDPSQLTMMRLKSAYRWVEPASSCPFKKRAVLIVAADGGEPLDDGRMIAHAGFSLGQHNGMSWAYRLEPGSDGWKIDARLESRNEMP